MLNKKGNEYKKEGAVEELADECMGLMVKESQFSLCQVKKMQKVSVTVRPVCNP